MVQTTTHEVTILLPSIPVTLPLPQGRATRKDSASSRHPVAPAERIHCAYNQLTAEVSLAEQPRLASGGSGPLTLGGRPPLAPSELRLLVAPSVHT